MVPVASGAAEARKRRKEIIQSQRGEGEAAAKSESSPPAADKEEKKPPKKRKVDDAAAAAAAKAKAASEEATKKTQIRYDPEVPMDKEQLANWRREARRVRNRESAAASRQRIRTRINELEDEVGQWKTKYQQAMERLAALQQSIKADDDDDAAAKI